MSIVLFNPTNEKMSHFYIGEDVVIEPNMKVKVDDARGRHLLTALGPRGLMSLEYGDDEDIRSKEGINRNKVFKEKQIIRYNQDNESRKQQGLPYVDPPEQIKDYSRELGMGLTQPYAVKDQDRQEISQLRQEKEDLHKQVKNLTNQMAELMNMMKEKGENVKGEIPDTDEAKKGKEILQIRKTYTLLGKDNLPGFVNKHKSEIPKWPLENQDEIRAKWASLRDDPFPI